MPNGKESTSENVWWWCFVGARKLTVDHGAGCVNAKWLDGALCGACAKEVESW